jgi:hypothetical protein
MNGLLPDDVHLEAVEGDADMVKSIKENFLT